MAHDHEHTEPPSDIDLRVKALESLLTEKGIIDPAAIEVLVASRHTSPADSFRGPGRPRLPSAAPKRRSGAITGRCAARGGAAQAAHDGRRDVPVRIGERLHGLV